MRSASLYWTLIAAGLKNELQYRANFLMMLVMGLVYQLTGAIFVWIVLSRFETIAGWGLGEVAFLYGLRLVIHGLQGVFAGRLMQLDWMIRQGEFDRILVRPFSPVLQVMSSRFNVNQLGDFAGGVTLFAAANALVGIDWSPLAIAFLVLAVIGGCMIEWGCALFVGGIAFRVLNVGMLGFLIDDVFNSFGNYPMTIYGGAVRFMLTFGLPLAFLAYFPATVLLGRTAELSVSTSLAYAAPVVGIVWFSLALLFWTRQMRHYQSAGH